MPEANPLANIEDILENRDNFDTYRNSLERYRNIPRLIGKGLIIAFFASLGYRHIRSSAAINRKLAILFAQ